MRARKKATESYRYTECGLDNVIIEGVEVVTDDSGEEVACIRNVRDLHRVIAHRLIVQERSLSGKELRFLRTEMGLTQEELGRLLDVARATINRWERERHPIERAAEVVIRQLAAERLGIDARLSVEEMAKRCVWRAETEAIRIDAAPPRGSRPITDDSPMAA